MKPKPPTGAATHPPALKPALLLSGLAILAAAWLGPLPGLAAESFFAHMTLHVTVVAVAAPLIAAGIANLPRGGWLLSIPVPASVLEFVVVWGWHAPQLHHLARADGAALVLEQASFLAAGLLLWASALRRAPEAGLAGILALLLTSMHMILLGTLLTLAPRPLYHAAGTDSVHAVLADQQAGGLLMLAGGALPYLAGGLWLVWLLLEQTTDDEAAGTPG